MTEGFNERQLRTWADVEKAALIDPILHAAVTIARERKMTHEQVLIEAVLVLSEVMLVQREQLIGVMLHAPRVQQ